MSTCPSCGGVIGRDCFNVIDCAAIAAQMRAGSPLDQRDAYIEQLRSELDSLRKQLARVEGLYEHLSKYVEHFGAIHEDGCSEDDTCNCVFKPTNEGVSCLCVALAGIDGDAKARREGRT